MDTLRHAAKELLSFQISTPGNLGVTCIISLQACTGNLLTHSHFSPKPRRMCRLLLLLGLRLEAWR